MVTFIVRLSSSVLESLISLTARNCGSSMSAKFLFVSIVLRCLFLHHDHLYVYVNVPGRCFFSPPFLNSAVTPCAELYQR